MHAISALISSCAHHVTIMLACCCLLCVLQLRKETYSRLTPTQRLQVARHPNRPTCLDIILNITDKFVELHGDRAGLDDPAIVCGIGSMDGVSFMFIGHQKGRNTKVRAAAHSATVANWTSASVNARVSCCNMRCDELALVGVDSSTEL
jgi:hypothetical protein